MKKASVGVVILLFATVAVATTIWITEPKPTANSNEIKPDSTPYLNLLDKENLSEIPLPKENLSSPERFKFPPIPNPASDMSEIKPDSTPYLNILDPEHPLHGKIPLPVRKHLPPPPDGIPNPGKGDYGTSINRNLDGIKGVYAGQEVIPDLSLPEAPPNRTLYAPTLESPNYAPLESVTAYWRYEGMTSTGRAWGVWDHTKGKFVLMKPIDSQFMSNYVRTFPEGQLYFIEVVYINNAWRVLLYNFNTDQWEEQYSSAGSSNRKDGWDIWESFFEGTCPSIPNIGSDYLQVYVNGVWKSVTSTYGSLLDYQNCPYQENMISNYHHWSVGP